MRSCRRGYWLAWAAAFPALVAFSTGCNDNALGTARRHPNLPPATTLASGPPDSSYGVNYKVHLYWSGADPDGAIDHFDFILVDHPAIEDSISTAAANDPRRVMVTVPAIDDPRWQATTSNDTLIISTADTLRVDPAPPPGGDTAGHDAFVRARSFERWHTFFVRAVDNQGLPDPVPEYRSFNSTTLAPTIEIQSPVNPALGNFKAPRVVIFRWTGRDPVGDGTYLAPIASRWAVIPTHVVINDFVDYPRALYGPDVPWSEWHRWDAADKSGVQAVVRNLLPVDGTGRGYYLFAVQAMDEAGAVTPVFDAGPGGMNNVAKVFVTDQLGPLLSVKEPTLGVYNFTAGARPVVLDIATGEPIAFRWSADASGYGGDIVAYRYGWNLRNPQNDEEWEQGWCSTCRAAPVRIYNSGTQRFFVEARDNAETVSRAEIELVVHPLTFSRDLLLVDDSVHFTTVGEQPPIDESNEDTRWAQVIGALRHRRPFAFDESRDVYDVEEHHNLLPPIPLLFDHKAIVWIERKTSFTSALSTLAVFFDPFLARNLNAVRPFNSLDIYLQGGGKFWLCGQQPTDVLWDFGADAPRRPYPVNVTNWRGYAHEHDERDSVGVSSFLWKLGVEVVDDGGGGRSNPLRDDVPGFYCTGFRRMAPRGSEQQTFTTSTAADHQHTIAVQTADVDDPPLAGVTYTTDVVLGHSHSLRLSFAQLNALGRGEQLADLPTSESAQPSLHIHTVSLQDQVGLWGAPLRLETETSLWAQPSDPNLNPNLGRPNVEIYNMTNGLQGNRPDPAIWVGLYGYQCAIQADPFRDFGYPFTPDGQPAVIVRRNRREDLGYSRALCGFEPFRLRLAAHIALADNILLRQFRLGLPDAR